MKKSVNYLPFVFLAMIFLIIVPVPPIVLDLLLIANIAIAAIIFLISLNATTILDFAILPTVLIFTTLFRIILNVTSSRLILGDATGGALIDAIGNFAIGGDYIVGAIIFVIITLVMFLVITKGSERVSEVSARFTLDALPGKQMSIDAELSSGSISSEEAKKRRNNLQKEADFYKSMDGASKFIKGDAIAGFIITIINVIGGLIMGMTRHGMGIGDAAAKYTILSIGDGLVNQIPSLLIAVATALMVTKSGDKDIVEDLLSQVVKYKLPLLITSIVFAILSVLGIIGVMNGLPYLITGGVSVGLYLLYKLDIQIKEDEIDEGPEVVLEESEVIPERALYQEKIKMKVGDNLISLISVRDAVTGKGYASPDMENKIDTLKKTIKKDYGVTIPEIRVSDDEYIQSNAFTIKIPNVQFRDIIVKPNCIVAQFLNENTMYDEGEPVAFHEIGIKGLWVNKSKQSEVEMMGAIVYTVQEIMIFYLEYVITNNLDKLITRKDISLFKEEVAMYNDAIIEEINTKNIENSVIQKVVQNLLKEKVPIKNFEYILECIADCILEYRGNATVDIITQYVRQQISSVLTKNKIEDGVLNVIQFTEETENYLKQYMSGKNINQELMEKCNALYINILAAHKYYTDLGENFVFVSEGSIRKHVFDVICNMGVKIDIISLEELPRANFKTIKEI